MTTSTKRPPTTIVWFRQDLRLDDNPALVAAIERAEAGGGAIVPVFIWSPEEEGRWTPGAASRWWLHFSLTALSSALRSRGAELLFLRGPSIEALRRVIDTVGADAVYWNRRYEPAVIARDTAIKSALRDAGIEVDSFNSALLHEPWTVATGQGSPYKVFTPFWRACLAKGDPAPPLEAPDAIPAPKRSIDRVSLGAIDLDSFDLLPTIDWAEGLRAAWTPGAEGAATQLAHFIANSIGAYAAERDVPSRPSTSRFSPHLHAGEISPRRIWHEVHTALRDRRNAKASAEKFLAEIGWREFAHHLIYHFPATAETPLRREFEAFPWRDDEVQLRAWQRGRTGYPMVDAGMRELWHTGWMHNRVRMVVASFLVKHLLLPWQRGAEWFWETLVDADLASNTLGWQWTAGCGADAAPYFRIFNPVMQGTKFDADGAYVRRWVPELAKLPDRHLHAPWDAPSDVLRAAGVELGATYPRPIVDHAAARGRALAALATISADKADLTREA